MADRHLELDIRPIALEELGKVGFDPVFGARPLKRAVQQYLENPLAKQILEGKFAEGSTIVVDYKADDFIFNEKQKAGAN